MNCLVKVIILISVCLGLFFYIAFAEELHFQTLNPFTGAPDGVRTEADLSSIIPVYAIAKIYDNDIVVGDSDTTSLNFIDFTVTEAPDKQVNITDKDTFQSVVDRGSSATGVGNITGSDVDISAGTGDITTSGTVQAGIFSDTVTTLTNGAFTTVVTGVYPTASSHLATKEYVDTAIAGLNFDLFLENTAAGIDPYAITTYSLQDIDPAGAEQSFTSANLTQDDQFVFAFATGTGLPMNAIEPGVIDGHFHFEKTGGAAMTVTAYWTLYHRDNAGAETLMATSEASGEITSKGLVDLRGNIAIEQIIAATDRLILKIYSNGFGGVAGQLKTYLEGTTSSHIEVRVATDALSGIFLRQDGITPLTANWNVGAFSITTAAQMYGIDHPYDITWANELSFAPKKNIYDKIDTVDTAVALNTSKVTNATHTGDVTGATALTIGADKILESMLKSVNAAVDEYALTYESTTGDFEWTELSSGTTIAAWQIWAATNGIYQIDAANGKIYASPYGDGFYFGTGTPKFGTAAQNVTVIEAGTAPTTAIPTAVQLWAENDEVDSDVVFLCSWNGADGATTAIDDSDSSHTITWVNTAQQDTAQKKYGTASLLLDGNSDSTTCADDADWTPGTGDYTWESWFRFNSTADFIMFFSQTETNTIDDFHAYKNSSGGSHKIGFWYGESSTTLADYIMTSAWSLAAGTWYHIAWVRDGIVIKIFIDGTSQALTEGVAVSTNNLADIAEDFYIGTWKGGSTYFNGWVDETRISKGIARYTANFIPRAAEFTTPLAEYNVMDGNGSVTTLSPHNFGLIPTEKIDSYSNPWSYNSYNSNYGKHITVDMYGAIKALEVLSGKTFIYEQDIPITPLKVTEEERLDMWVRVKRQKEIEFRAAQKILLQEEYDAWVATQPIIEPAISDTEIIR